MKRKTKNKIKKIIFYIFSYLIIETIFLNLILIVFNNCITTIK